MRHVSYLFLGLLAAHIAAGAAISAFLIRWARGRDKSGLKFTIPIVVGSYLLVFWDVIPTAVVHDYLCRTEAGVTVFKSANAWAMEHAGEMKAIGRPNAPGNFRFEDGHSAYWLTSRHYIEFKETPTSVFPVRVHHDNVVDATTGEVVLQKRWITSGYRRADSPFGVLSVFKGWVGLGDCFKQVSEFQREVKRYEELGGNAQ